MIAERESRASECRSRIELLPILGIKLDCRRRIFSSRHQSWTFSIRSIFSWCSESSSRLKTSNSLCSDFFRMSCSVTARNRIEGWILLRKLGMKSNLEQFTFHHFSFSEKADEKERNTINKLGCYDCAQPAANRRSETKNFPWQLSDVVASAKASLSINPELIRFRLKNRWGNRCEAKSLSYTIRDICFSFSLCRRANKFSNFIAEPKRDFNCRNVDGS